MPEHSAVELAQRRDDAEAQAVSDEWHREHEQRELDESDRPVVRGRPAPVVVPKPPESDIAF